MQIQLKPRSQGWTTLSQELHDNGFAITPNGPIISQKFLNEIRAASIESIAEAFHEKARATYPADHQAAMRVPKGGSSCASCKYVSDDGKDCSNEHYQTWNGSKHLPYAADEYCSDWYEPKKEIAAGGIGSGCHGPNCGRPSKDNYLETKTGDAQGTNKGGFYRGADGKDRYVKFYKDPVQGKVEVLANEIYRDLGIGAPKSTVFNTATGEAFGSELIHDSKELNAIKITPAIAGKIMDGFAADVLTANWDAVGLEKDNIRVISDGTPHRVDNGGSFLFRAQTGRKPDSLLNNPTETKGFFDPKVNRAYQSVAKTAGYTSVASMGHELERQVNSIAALEHKSGGWDKYVSDKVPGLTGSDRDKVVGMLNARTAVLKNLAGIHASFEGGEGVMDESKGWHGVDLDGTIAYHKTWKGITHIGKPIIGQALAKVKLWLKKGEKVKIFTARASDPRAIKPIEKFCMAVFGQKLEITDRKDENMIDLLDDRVLRVEENTGKLLAATETSGQGSLWNGIKLVGFTGPQEEAIRAILSRIPPELLIHVLNVQSADELNAKHGRYLPDEHKILFNPGNLVLRQRFGKGELPILHADLTLVHEVGHSLYKALTAEEKWSWLTISGWLVGTKKGQAPAYVEKRPGWEHSISKWTHKVGAKFSRYYGEKNPDEDFSDCFAFYLMNKAHEIGDKKKEFFDAYIQAHVKRYPQASIQSPIKAGGNHARSHETAAKWKSNGHGNGNNIRSSEHRHAKLQRDGFKPSLSQRSTSQVQAGGEGSGCDEGVAESHGTSCGPKKEKAKPYEKMKEKVAKHQSGESSKVGILGGIWPSGTAPVHVYKAMMTGEWHTVADLIGKMDQGVLQKWTEKQQKGEWSIQERVISGIKRVEKAGQMFGQWKMQQQYSASGEKQYKLVMNLVHDQAKGQTGITPELQHDALTVIQKMVSNTGLDNTVSKQAMGEYLKSVGLKDVDLLASSVSSWTSDPDGEKAQMLKRIAADYYGNDWSKEWKDGHKDTPANDTTKFKYDDLKKQAMAIKSLSNEYVKASGLQYLYRGMTLPSDKMAEIKQAHKEGKLIPIPLNSATGFSTKISTAGGFGTSFAVRIKVNPEDVWVASGALPHMFGSFASSEKEYIVGSKSNTVAYFKPEDVWIKSKSYDEEQFPIPAWANKAAGKSI
jgi:hypothetical protein